MRIATPRFVRETICATCVAPGDERLGTKLSFLEIRCQRCDAVLLDRATIVQRALTALRRGNGISNGYSATDQRDRTSAAGFRKGPPGDELSPKDRDMADHGSSPAYADLLLVETSP